MLGTVIRHEWHMLYADRAVWIVFAIVAVAVGYAGWHGRSAADRERIAIEAFEEQQASEIAAARSTAIEMKARLDAGLELRTLSSREQVQFSNGPLNSVYASRVAAFGTRPPAPLEALSLGDDLHPRAQSIGDNSLISDKTAGESTANPLRLAIGHFDLTFVVLHLYPLLVISLAYNLLTTEKETGILKLLLAQPVRPTSLFGGALIVRATFLVTSVVALSGLALASSGLDLSSGDAGIRFAIWSIATGSYCVFWFALVAFVASKGRGAAANALLLCTCWLAGVVVLPQAVQLAVTAIYPVPSRVEYVQALRSARELVTMGVPEKVLVDDFFETNRRFARGREDSELAIRYTAAVARFNRIAREVEPLQARMNTQQESQERLFAVLRYLTPTTLVERLIHDVTGTGPRRNRLFVAGIEEVRRQRRAFFWQRQIDLATITADDYASMPRNQFQEESLQSVVRRMLAPLGAIAAVSGALLFSAIRNSRQSLIQP